MTGTFTVSTAPPTPVSLGFEGFPSPQIVPGGTNFYLMALQLTAAAPKVGGTISLTSSNPAVAPVPATVSMPGFAWGQIPMTLAEVTVPTPVTVTATLNGVSTTDQFTVLPATMTSISASPPAVSGRLPGGPVGESAGPGPRRRGRGEPLEQLSLGGRPADDDRPPGLLVRVRPVDDDERDCGHHRHDHGDLQYGVSQRKTT